VDLKRKLSRLGGAGPAPVPAPVPASTPPALNLLAPGPGRRKATPLPAEERSTPHGALFAREHLYPSHHRHGTAELRAALGAEPELVAALALDPALREVDPRRMLLLDTETTGLAGGTGTLPFVVGLGWFEGEQLKVTQLLLRRPGEERPMLRRFAERLAESSLLVTYNGKSFDWPLLRSRFVMNRLEVPPLPAHLDLLHCARRVFKRRMSGARLVQLEEEILGFHRVGDVPGAEIPELYFRYLRTGDGGSLAPVLEHNVHDMALLAALLGELVRQFRSAEVEADPRDQLGFASIAARAGDGARAVAFAEAAAATGDRAVCAEALALAAEVSRRKGDLVAAVAALERAVAQASGLRLSEVHLALAKLHEHRTGSLARALDHARHTLLAEGALANQKRMARLEKRAVALQRATARPASLLLDEQGSVRASGAEGALGARGRAAGGGC
jgi:uncharacterized protein YprB with RNaseH-like and TPR domain